MNATTASKRGPAVAPRRFDYCCWRNCQQTLISKWLLTKASYKRLSDVSFWIELGKLPEIHVRLQSLQFNLSPDRCPRSTRGTNLPVLRYQANPKVEYHSPHNLQHICLQSYNKAWNRETHMPGLNLQICKAGQC